MDYEKDLEINELALDREWISQPKLFMQYAEQQAHVLKARDLAKEVVDVVHAELDSEARKQLSIDGKKPTEAQIANWIIQQEEYRNAVAEFIEATFLANMTTNTVRAMDQRKTALENMVRLWIGQYYSTPKEPEESDGKLVERIEKSKLDKQRKGLKKGREK